VRLHGPLGNIIARGRLSFAAQSNLPQKKIVQLFMAHLASARRALLASLGLHIILYYGLALTKKDSVFEAFTSVRKILKKHFSP
jgi:hypothetical protein